MERRRNFYLSAIWLIHVYHKTLLQIINHDPVFRGGKKKNLYPIPVYDISFTIFRLGFQSRSGFVARSIRKIRGEEEYLMK